MAASYQGLRLKCTLLPVTVSGSATTFNPRFRKAWIEYRNRHPPPKQARSAGQTGSAFTPRRLEICFRAVATRFAGAFRKLPLPAGINMPRSMLSSGDALPQMGFRRMQPVWIELFGDHCLLGGELAHPESGGSRQPRDRQT